MGEAIESVESEETVEEIEQQQENEEATIEPIEPFSIKIDVEKLKDVATISKIIEEANITLNESGLHIRETDRSVVCLIDLSIPREDFVEFNIDKEVKFGINLQLLTTIMKGLDSYIAIESDGKKIIVKTDNNEKFELPIIDVESNVPEEIKDLKFDVELDVDIRKWKKLIEKAQLIGADIVTLEVKGGILKATAKQDYDGILKYEIILKNSVETKNVKSSYPMSYLKQLKFKMSGYFEDTIKLKFSKDYPLMLEKDNLKVLLAPRVVEEE